MIKPTVGRVILFHAGAHQHVCSLHADGTRQPVPALITAVHSDTLINIGGFDANGVPFAATSVQLVQPGEQEPNDDTSFAYWMDYQKGQAAKTEALEKLVCEGQPATSAE